MRYELKAPIDKNLSVVEQVLTVRGIKDVNHYLNVSDADIYPPEQIKNIQEGARMLIKHIKDDDDAYLVVDCDCDGYTSAATLINYLNFLFPHYVETKIKYYLHDDKFHGIVLEDVPETAKLVIVPDAGSNQYDVHKELRDRGVDVLVIDHHEADYESPDACVINNQISDYPTKSLSGAGMVYKFCSYLDTLLEKHYADKLLDLVALGLIADMVDIRDYETHRLIEKGLKQIDNPFIAEMVSRNSGRLSSNLTPTDVAFYIAPYVNAMCRSGTIEEKTLLFEAMLNSKGKELIPSTKRGCVGQFETRAEQAGRVSGNVKTRQKTTVDKFSDKFETIIKEKKLLQNNKILVIKNDESNGNIAGLIANQLVGKYQRPVLILAPTETEDGLCWSGSGRGYGIEDFRQFLLNTGDVVYAEGHQGAFGTSIADDKFDKFIADTNDLLKDYDFTPKYDVDYIFNIDTINSADVYAIADLSYLWGQNIPEPYIAIEGISVFNGNLKQLGAKGETIKIAMPNGIDLIKFRSSKDEYEELYSDLGCVTINVVGRCSRNSYNGHDSPQIIIECYEIVGRTAYYF